MRKFLRVSMDILPLFLLGAMGGCALTSGMQQRFAACNYEHAWDAAIDAVKDRTTHTKDKEAGLIVTEWLEIPMPGRTYGVFRRDVMDSKDRSRLTLKLKRVDDATRISFIEQRQRWAFLGGSRLFGWAPTDPSDEVMHDVQNRLDNKLKEHGCSVT